MIGVTSGTISKMGAARGLKKRFQPEIAAPGQNSARENFENSFPDREKSFSAVLIASPKGDSFT